MSRASFKLLAGAVFLCGVSLLQGATTFVITPVSVVSNTGGDFSAVCCDIVDTINENGLSALGNQFVSGSTDWNSYFAGNPLHTWVALNPSGTTGADDYEWFSQEPLATASIIYNLGQTTDITGMALWNEDSIGVGTITLFGCSDSVCTIPTLLLATTAVTDNPINQDYGAQLFSFALATTSYVEVVVTPSAGNDDLAIGSIAFEAVSPEPGTWMLMGLGLAVTGLASYRRRRRANAVVAR